MILTFYKGITLTHAITLTQDHLPSSGSSTGNGRWIIGCIALIAACISWCSWFLIQSKVNKIYPALYRCTAIIFFMSFLQSAVLTLAIEGSSSLLAVRGKLLIITVLFAVISLPNYFSVSPLSVSASLFLSVLLLFETLSSSHVATGHRGFGIGVSPNALVHQQERARLPGGIHPHHTDRRSHYRLRRNARASSSWKVAIPISLSLYIQQIWLLTFSLRAALSVLSSW